MAGYINMNRELETEELIVSDQKAFCLLALISLRARYRVVNTDPHKLQIGEAFIGDYKRLGFKRQEYRSALDRLVKCNHLEIVKSTNKGTIVRLCTPVFSVNSEMQGNHQRTIKATSKQPTSNQPATNQQPLTNKERRKEGKKGTIIPLSPSGSECDSDMSSVVGNPEQKWTKAKLDREQYENYPNFLTWWKAYPNATGKRAAFHVWLRRGLEREDQDPLLRVLRMHIDDWAKKGMEYVPHGQTYLNQHRDEDGVEELMLQKNIFQERDEFEPTDPRRYL